MTFNSLKDADFYIKSLGWHLGLLIKKKHSAMSITEFYNYGKEIREKKQLLEIALKKYFAMERSLDVPVNLEYRRILKKLNGLK